MTTPMHLNTKLTPPTRKEVYKKWCSKKYSLRALASEYHVDKKVISRIIIRGKKKDFSVHDSTNLRFKNEKKSGRAQRSRKIIKK